MDITPTIIEGLYEITAKVFRDQRGDFVKTFHLDRFTELGLNTRWRERFWSSSHAGVIRGLHFQIPPSDHVKLVTCCAGKIWDVVVDLRRSSPTFGKYVGLELTADNGRMLYIPRGMAHGFLALTEGAVVQYDVETVHDPACDRGIRWDGCGISWPIQGQPVMSTRDAAFPCLSDFESPF